MVLYSLCIRPGSSTLQACMKQGTEDGVKRSKRLRPHRKKTRER